VSADDVEHFTHPDTDEVVRRLRHAGWELGHRAAELSFLVGRWSALAPLGKRGFCGACWQRLLDNLEAHVETLKADLANIHVGCDLKRGGG
jgi:hypothetical protein